MTYDLKITGGTLLDGTGRPAVRGDLAVRDGRIVAVGEAPGAARQTLDAGGLAVAPGFIDIHTHYDAQVLWDPRLTISPWHGVTTVVMGNCGFGVAPTRPEHRGLVMRTLEKVEGMSLEVLESGLSYDWPFVTFPEYLDALEARGPLINVGVMIGHTPLRLFVMGEDATERSATEAEIARMRAIVRDAIDAGAVGFATSKAATHVGYGGKPVPSRAADLAEIQTLAGALGEAGRGIVQATVGRELFLDEFAAIVRATGRPLTWTALLAGMAGFAGPAGHREILARSRELAAQGLPIVPQVTCRPLNFEFQFKEPFIFEAMSLFRPVSAADFEGKMRIYADADFRRAFKERAARPQPGVAGKWDRTWIAWCPGDPSLEERTVEHVAAERGVHPIDLALDLALASKLEARFRMAVFNDDEDEVAALLAEPATVLGLSDAGAHASQLCDACFSTYLLGRWVREKGAFTLEEAVRMLTSRPAEVFGISDRGRLEVGLAADVVVFDPATVAAGPLRRVRDLPAGGDRLVAEARGIEAVIVNGTVVRRSGKDLVGLGRRRPGRVLRGGHA
jgi:N-acyl-D-aspartate/D-glutamate deacylase